MVARELRERAEKLRQEIEKARYAYHVEDRDLLAPEVLDSLKKELFDLESKYPELITPDSPTQRVGGAPLSKFRKVTHFGGDRLRMNSLNDAFSEKDVRAWLKRLEDYLGKSYRGGFYCDLKMDGLAVELTYQDGVFTAGATRGDGLVGEDITQNLRTIEAIPLRLKSSLTNNQFPKELAVRGEVFLTKKEFARLNAEQRKSGEKEYANPRNVAAGSLRQLNPKITAARRLDFYAYGIPGDGAEYFKKYPTRAAEYAALRAWGIKTNPNGIVASSLEKTLAFHAKWAKEREKLSYEIDGVVISVNDNRVFRGAGIIGKAPRGGIAYKFSPREATTVVEDIKVQVGRTGALTPVAVLKPVNVGGITITHATLHNFDEIARLGVKIGDTVVVSRAGDVIPQIREVLTKLRMGRERPFKMPAKCPVDGSALVKPARPGDRGRSGGEGVVVRCGNPECAARHRESLYHFVSRAGFDIRGLGWKIIDKFLDEGLIGDAADIFTLHKGDIAALPRFGEKSAENIVREVEEKKRVTLPRFIYSLGILHVGEETAIALSRVITNYQLPIIKPIHIMKAFQKLSRDDLQNIPDIGPVVSESIYEWFRESRNVALLKKLDAAGIQITNYQLPITAGKLTGKTFVLTGSLASMSREEAKERIRALGGEITEAVSRKTSYVVAGEEPGSKLDHAKKLDVPVLGEKEFQKMIGGK